MLFSTLTNRMFPHANNKATFGSSELEKHLESAILGNRFAILVPFFDIQRTKQAFH